MRIRCRRLGSARANDDAQRGLPGSDPEDYGGCGVALPAATCNLSRRRLQRADGAGIKARLAGDTLQLNASIFKYNYKDLQVNVDDPLSPLVPLTRNIGEADMSGIEADLWWAPSDGLDIKLGVGYLDAEFEKTNRSITTYVGPIPLQGKRPVNTPEWTYNGLIRYERPLNSNLSLVLMGDFRWTDERFLEATNQVFDRADDYMLVNARAAIVGPDGRWEAALGGKNITDEAYLYLRQQYRLFQAGHIRRTGKLRCVVQLPV